MDDKKIKLNININQKLLEKTKKKFNISSDSTIVEMALESMLDDDGFAKLVEKIRGSVDKDIDLEFFED